MSEQIKLVMRQLPLPLTPSEKCEAAEEIGELQQLLDEQERAKKQAAEYHNEQIQQHRSRIRDLAHEIRNGRDAEVQCEAIYDFSMQRVTISRLDTGEVVDERPMTDGERQGELL